MPVRPGPRGGSVRRPHAAADVEAIPRWWSNSRPPSSPTTARRSAGCSCRTTTAGCRSPTRRMGGDQGAQSAARKVVPSTWKEFAEFMQNSPKPVEERFYNVRIDTNGAVGSVWFDFDFLVDGKVTIAAARAGRWCAQKTAGRSARCCIRWATEPIELQDYTSELQLENRNAPACPRARRPAGVRLHGHPRPAIVRPRPCLSPFARCFSSPAWRGSSR